MAKKVILGSDFGRDAFKTKVNDNFTELYNTDVALEGQINSFVDGTKLVGKAKYLQTNDMGATDPNALIESGLYLINHANNPSNDLYYINVIKHPVASDYITQMAKYVFGTETYIRRKIGGSWTAWEKIITNKQINWITATLQNGWTGTLQYRKNALGQIELRGNVTPGTTTVWTTIATLPSEYKPYTSVPISIAESSNTKNYFVYSATGNLTINSATPVSSMCNINAMFI